MPVANQPTNGPHPNVAAMPVRFQTLTFAVAAQQFTNPLFADGLPGLRVWVLQTLGAGLVTVEVQFADGNGPGGVPDWQPLVPPFAVALLVPSLTPFSLGSRRYRLAVTSTGAATVRVRTVAALI